MQALFIVLVAPLMILNLLGGLVGGVWLAFAGEWDLIGLGLAYLFLGTLICSIAMLPGMLLAAPAIVLAQRRPLLAAFLGIPAVIWTALIIGVTCLLVFKRSVDDIDGSIWPYLLWGHAVALGPWSYMASKEDSESFAQASMFFAGLGVVSMMIAVFIEPMDTSMGRLALWLTPPLAVGLILQFVFIFAVTAEERRRLNWDR